MNRRTLPLFPLQEVVLFPGMALPLQIFEPRYVRLVRSCLKNDRRFGVALIREGQEVGGPAEPWPVGTVAVIQQANQLAEDGPIVLLVVGEERFRILRTWVEQDLLYGEVEPIHDDPATAEGLGDLPERVRARALEHLELVGRAIGRQFAAPDFPASPVELSFLLAGAVQGEPLVRQRLLAGVDTKARLEALVELLGAQVANLGERLAIQAEVDRLTGGNCRLKYHHLTQALIDKLSG